MNLRRSSEQQRKVGRVVLIVRFLAYSTLLSQSSAPKIASTGSVLARAWYGDILKSLTKNSPARATDPHVSIVGHCTSQELIRNLDSTEAANGFANRFLWIYAERSKLLPDGGAFETVDLSRVTLRLQQS